MIVEAPDAAVHVFTVDVEEYFQVGAFESTISRADWDVLPSRVARSTDRLLEILDRHEVEATFFCLGWVARRHPDVVRRIADAGHELGSHGWWHRRITETSREEFRHEVRNSKAEIEDITGEPVRGFRAPNFSLVPGVEWALDILLEEGYTFDSSIFPVRRLGYGYAGAPTRPYRVQREAGSLLELPLATTEMLKLRLPAAGGNYLRQLPFALVRRAFRESTEAGESGVFYVHPWELDPDQPKLPVPMVAKLRHYGGLDRMAARLERLLGEFRFTSVRDRYGTSAAAADEEREPTDAAAPVSRRGVEAKEVG